MIAVNNVIFFSFYHENLKNAFSWNDIPFEFLMWEGRVGRVGESKYYTIIY